MAFGIKLEVWGDYAAFNRPEMKVERASYDVMTPSAARGILEAIYWKPEMRWRVDAIHVLRPIRFTQIRRNEVSVKVPLKGPTGAETALNLHRGRLGVNVADVRQQRAAMVLRDVLYGIEAHVETVESSGGASPEAKHLEMFKRRAARGQYFHHPYLGVREFPADFRLVESFTPPHDELLGDRDFGYMLNDIEFRPSEDGHVVDAHQGRRLTATPRFFQAVMRDGVIRVPPLSEGRS